MADGRILPRVHLRPLALDDEAFVVALYGNPQSSAEIGALAPDDARRLFARARVREHGDFHIVLMDGLPVGLAGLTPRERGVLEAGVVLSPSSHRRGIGFRTFAWLAMRALADPGVVACRIRHRVGHTAMRGLARRLGLEEESTADAGYSRWVAHRDRWRSPVAAGMLPTTGERSPGAGG